MEAEAKGDAAFSYRSSRRQRRAIRITTSTWSAVGRRKGTQMGFVYYLPLIMDLNENSELSHCLKFQVRALLVHVLACMAGQFLADLNLHGRIQAVGSEWNEIRETFRPCFPFFSLVTPLSMPTLLEWRS